MISHRDLAFAMLAFLCLAAAAVASCGSTPARARHLSAGCAASREIALTFDDGPNTPFTSQILDMLTAAGVRATFFVEGQAAEAQPAIVREEAARGMAIGSHSYTHSSDLPTMSHAAFAEDLRKAEDALTAALGERPTMYRSPFGHTSDTMLEEERKRGYTSIGWDLDSEDWSNADAGTVVKNVLDGAHPGAIVLMHDGGLGGGNRDRATTIAALPRILAGLRDQGYALVTVPEIIGLGGAAANGTSVCSAN